MDGHSIHNILVVIQHTISFLGILVILTGILIALFQYAHYFVSGRMVTEHGLKINSIRLSLGRALILGLEFIVAADLIGTTTAPDYYTVGILAIIVLIRTVLSFSLNRELMSLGRDT